MRVLQGDQQSRGEVGPHLLMSTGISLLAGRGIIVKPKVPSVKRWRDFRDVAAKDGLVRDFSSGLRAKVLIPL